MLKMSIDVNKLKIAFPDFSIEDLGFLAEYLDKQEHSISAGQMHPKVVEIFTRIKKKENDIAFNGKGFVELKAGYMAFGLEVEQPKEPARFCETMVVAPYDGVNYTIDDHGGFLKSGDSKGISSGVKNRQNLIDSRHEIIKSVYEYCVGLDLGYIWVMVSNNSVFIGNHSGYLAILYLHDFDPEEEYPDYDHNGNLAHCMSVNFKHNNIYFENKFKMDGICLRLSE